MNQIHKFTTPAGERMVILAEADYDHLMAQAEDNADIEKGKAVLGRIHSGQEDVFPADVAKALLLGDESPIRILRKWRGLTAEALAKQAGLSRAYLTQIETGARAGSAAALQHLAKALRVDVALLLPE